MLTLRAYRYRQRVSFWLIIMLMNCMQQQAKTECQPYERTNQQGEMEAYQQFLSPAQSAGVRDVVELGDVVVEVVPGLCSQSIDESKEGQADGTNALGTLGRRQRTGHGMDSMRWRA